MTQPCTCLYTSPPFTHEGHCCLTPDAPIDCHEDVFYAAEQDAEDAGVPWSKVTLGEERNAWLKAAADRLYPQ